MSHTQIIRQEIADNIPKPEKLRRCMLFGLLLDAKIESDRVFAAFSSENAALSAQKLAKILFYATFTQSETHIAGRVGYDVVFDSHKLATELATAREELASSEGVQEEIEYVLRGAFLTLGRINDPMAQSHMEFSFSNESTAEGFAAFLLQNSLPTPGMTTRRNKRIVYFKSNEKICDMLSAMGVGNILFEYINTGIYRDIGNSEHRATNCISGNINRAVIAGSRHRAACEYLINVVGEGNVDSGLVSTARLRIDNPTMSLTELAEMHIPPLTKSGISHRLKKITDIAVKNGFVEEKE